MSDTSIQIHLIVEGQTEQSFVDKILKPEFDHKGIYITASLLGKTGGDIKFQRLTTHLRHFRAPSYVSTMFDFFRIDSQWPGQAEIIKLEESRTQLTPEGKAKILEDATAKKIDREHFIPHIQMYEFEALLFSDPEAWREVSAPAVDYIQGIVNKYSDPEAINDGAETAPSKRLLKNIMGYQKVVYGINIAQKIGLARMREKCSHFNQWLTKLEDLKPLS